MPARRTGRYSLERATAEVARRIQALPRGGHSRAAEALGISSQALTKRLGVDYIDKLSIEEIGILADHLGAPAGWPFIPWDEAADRDEVYRTRGRRNPATKQPPPE